jgi:hypothetical protein
MDATNHHHQNLLLLTNSAHGKGAEATGWSKTQQTNHALPIEVAGKDTGSCVICDNMIYAGPYHQYSVATPCGPLVLK